MSYVVKLKRSTNTISVKHITRNVTLNHVGRRGLTGPMGPTGPTGPQGPPGEGGTGGGAVDSVNSQTGVVVLGLTDISGISPTKGTILVGDGTTWNSLPIGEDDLVLTADSSQATGLAWAVGSGGTTPVSGSYSFMDDSAFEFMDGSYFDFMDS